MSAGLESDAGDAPQGPRPRVAEAAWRGRGPRDPSELSIDVWGTVRRLRRLFNGDARVFTEVAGDAGQTLTSILVVAVAALVAGLGGWAWLALDASGLSTGRIAVRELVLGGAFAVAFWFVGILATQAVLRTLYDYRADRGRLVRTVGLAAGLGVLQIAMIITPLAFAVGVATLIALFLAWVAAVRAAVPECEGREAFLSAAAGFGVFLVAMTLLAEAGGMAPGAFAHGAELSVYI